MWDSLIQGASNLFWWSNNRGVPNGTPPDQVAMYKNTNHFASKKFTMCFISLAITIAVFAGSTAVLFFLPSEALITAFVVLFKETISIVGLVVSVLIGAQGLVDLKYNSNTDLAMMNANTNETQTIKEEQIYRCEKLDPKDIPGFDEID